MIDLLFNYFNELILVRIEGKRVLFGNTTYGAKMAEIDGLKLSKSGVIKEFPDLKDRNDWRIEAIKRFKEKISNMNEEQISEYIIKDLTKYGYKPISKQVNGFRIEKLR